MPLLIIEGDGKEKEILEKFVINNKLENDIKFIGNTTYIFNLINASDFIVLPSIGNEDFPNITIESMSLGKPVIGTRVAGIPEQIDHGKTGLIVEPKNENDLANAIKKMLNFNLIKSFSLESKKKFNLNYTVENSLSEYIKIYK